MSAVELDRDAFYRALQTRDARFDGRLFVAVRTTGIYCRPICPARTPKLENITFFVSAAACQEAGYRPCLRCRPETSPDVGAWHGSSSTVARALALIEGGALDSGDVESLAERLGIGDRQLRRLFQAHLGASPLAVAQTRRIHLAKQLIHDTSLSMSDVAMASGFGSVRRFNETFQHLFGRAPGTLRRTKAGAPAAGTPVTLVLPYAEPYDFASLLGFLKTRAIPGVESVSDKRYARTIATENAHGTLSVEADRPGRLRLTVHLPNLTALPSLIARARRLLDLAADPEAIAAHLSTDALLAPLVLRRPGLRVPGAWDGFELAVRAILGQQVTVVAATRLAGTLAELCGETVVSSHPALSRIFPTPERVAACDLTKLGMPRSRARTITALAQAVIADPDLLSGGKSLELAVERLRAIPGIGEWTAQYVAMRELREPDAFPAMDVGILKALGVANGGARPSAARALELAESWRPWRAYAALHLWASLEDAAPERTEEVEKENGRRVA
ncbi:MAG TPA: DNA-3-methyladenine glycosylase 2 family protein [Polyangiaceae bacterium]|jgi:AraC family transcriptional regulator of adaptative response / DNA-3-methyladenine glycosylase II|nr:DNA-3-methyladenine glycosylase 2 family protein [Polyangiaceae bacterium]